MRIDVETTATGDAFVPRINVAGSLNWVLVEELLVASLSYQQVISTNAVTLPKVHGMVSLVCCRMCKLET